jgi:hypothetical protein
MVSLRQRKSRPSYTSLAGLENISDGEDESMRPQDERVSSAPLQNGKDVEDGHESDVSMSSGASSEFNPAPDEDRKGRKGGRGKGKGKRRATSGARSGSDFEAGSPGSSEDVSDGAESDSIQSENEAMDDLEVPTPVRKTGKKGRASSRPRITHQTEDPFLRATQPSGDRLATWLCIRHHFPPPGPQRDDQAISRSPFQRLKGQSRRLARERL